MANEKVNACQRIDRYLTPSADRLRTYLATEIQRETIECGCLWSMSDSDSQRGRKTQTCFQISMFRHLNMTADKNKQRLMFFVFPSGEHGHGCPSHG